MRRFALFAWVAGLLVPFLTPAPAYSQAARTWVSAAGDDGDPCSRSAPCKTFAAAIAATSINGEIDCVDSGGYGTLTILKSVTIDCTGALGSVLAASAPAISINIAAGNSDDPLATVRLRGISLSGQGASGTVGTRLGTRGVEILSAAAVILEDVVISDFAQQGIADLRSAPGRLFVKNSMIRNIAGVGILAAGANGTNISIENVHSINNAYGLATATGNAVKITRSVFSGNTTGIEADGGAQVGVEHSTVNFNTTALQSNGAIWVSDVDVSFNQNAIAGSPVNSFGNNRFYANTSLGGTLAVGAASTDHGQQ
jgi:hypothetical protein